MTVPETIEAANKGGDPGSDNHIVLIPVVVIVCAVLIPTPGGDMENEADDIVKYPVRDPSDIVTFPIDEPVVTTIVAVVVDVIFCETFITPETPDKANTVTP